MSDQVNTESVLLALAQTLEQRKQQSAQKSYVASLYAGGDDAILKKVGEEATEVILAAKEYAGEPDGNQNKDQTHLVKEVADLWFHTLVLLAHKGLSPSDVLNELESRFGLSGHAEKAARSTPER